MTSGLQQLPGGFLRDISESTVCGFKMAYLNERHSKRLTEAEDLTIKELPTYRHLMQNYARDFNYREKLALQKLSRYIYFRD